MFDSLIIIQNKLVCCEVYYKLMSVVCNHPIKNFYSQNKIKYKLIISR